MRSILSSWKPGNYEATQLELVDYFFQLLGQILVLCNVPLNNTDPVTKKKRIKLYASQTASTSSTVAEECIALIRKLHPLPAWNKIINNFIGDVLQSIPKLVMQSEVLSQSNCETHLSNEEQVNNKAIAAQSCEQNGIFSD